MSFNNLKKNDVVFSESKGSRVFKLISKKDNHWVVGDMFTKKFDIITESDTFRVVKTKGFVLVTLPKTTDKYLRI